MGLHAPLDETDVPVAKSRRLLRTAGVLVALAVLLGVFVCLATRDSSDHSAAGQAERGPAPAASGKAPSAPVAPASGMAQPAGGVPVLVVSQVRAEERSEPNTPEERYVRNYILDRVNDPSSVKFLRWRSHHADGGNGQISVGYWAKNRHGVMEHVEQDFTFQHGSFVAASPPRKQ